MKKYLKYKKKYLALKKGGAAERIKKYVLLFKKFIDSNTLTKDEIDHTLGVDVLPTTLTNLTVGYNFKQSTDAVFLLPELQKFSQSVM